MGLSNCLLSRGAAKVYAVDTGYGVLDWKLRRDAHVVTMERTNAMHVSLPEKVQLVTIDVAWTRQRNILPAARKLLAGDGRIVTLIKPHYEAERMQLKNGVLAEEHLDGVINKVKDDVRAAGYRAAADGGQSHPRSKGEYRSARTAPAHNRCLKVARAQRAGDKHQLTHHAGKKRTRAVPDSTRGGGKERFAPKFRAHTQCMAVQWQLRNARAFNDVE